MLGQSCGTTYKSINVNIITEFVVARVAFGIVLKLHSICMYVAPDSGDFGWVVGGSWSMGSGQWAQLANTAMTLANSQAPKDNKNYMAGGPDNTIPGPQVTVC